MKSPTYTILGPPIPQARPRILRNGIHYDPRAKDKQKIREELLFQRNTFKESIIKDPIFLRVLFSMSIPNSLSKKKQSLLIGQPCIKRNGDIDNLIKLVLDCCKNILFLDDAQVFSLCCMKLYAPTDFVRTEFHFIYGAENEEKVNP
jgi:Holliday junction resolvase RusA-like endonuclease